MVRAALRHCLLPLSCCSGFFLPSWIAFDSPGQNLGCVRLQPLLSAVEALSSLASEAALTLEVEQQLGLEIHNLTEKMQLLPKESLGLFVQECHKQATQGFKLHMPRGRYWRLRLCPGNFSFFLVPFPVSVSSH